MTSRCRWTVLIFILLIAIAIIAVAIVVVPILKTILLNEKLKENLVLEKGRTVYNQWMTPNIGPMYKIFTMYTVKNAEQASEGEKIELAEVGPYYFREIRRKFSPNYTEDGTVIRYKQNKYYVFDRNRTNPRLDPDVDKITTLNVVLATVIDLYLKKNISEPVAFGAVSIADLFVTKSVTELLWGYSDTLIDLAHTSNLYPRTNFSLQINNSAGDYLNWSAVKTGKENSDEIGEFVEWDGKAKLKYWNSTYANMINGTEGFFFRAGLKQGDNVSVFIDDLFRSANLTCNETTELESIHLLRCLLPEWEMQNASMNPLNAQWYANSYSGFLNESSANYRAPLFISKPHFLDVDPEVKTNLTGLRPPNRELDDTTLDVEPITGALFRTHKRLQANVQIRRVPETLFKLYKVSKVRDAFVPIFYVEETVTANTTTCNTFKSQVYGPMDIIGGVQWGLVALGGLIVIICIIVAGMMIGKALNAKEKDVPLLSSHEINN